MDNPKDTSSPDETRYLPEFRVQGLDYYHTAESQGATSISGTTPWENHQSTAKEHPTAISELQKDGIVLETPAEPKDTSDAPLPSTAANKYKQFKGLVRLTRDQYDHVIRIRPGAALKYVDEDDGELINVGSSFELEQRLQEPIDGQVPVTVADFSKCIPVSEKPRHSFTIANSPTVKSIWRGWENETHMRRWGASQGAGKSTSVELSKSTEQPTPPNYHYFPPSVTEELATRLPALDSRKTDSGSRPSMSTSSTSQMPSLKEHEDRWASYGSLPGSLDKQAVPLFKSNGANEGHFSAKAETSSTTTSPATGQSSIEVNEIKEKDYTHVGCGIPVPPIHESSNIAGKEAVDSGPSDTPPQAHEHLASSVLSLIEQFGNLAAEAFRPSPELSEQLILAKKEIPQNLEMALRASANAVDQVRNVVYAANRPETTSSASASRAPAMVSADDRSKETKQTLGAENLSDTKPKFASEEAAVPMGSTKVYQAERILGSRQIVYGDHPSLTFKQYLVRWVGRPDIDDVWYDEENLGDCSALIADYETRNCDKYRNMFQQVAEASDMHTRTSGDKMITHPRSYYSNEQFKRQQGPSEPQSSIAANQGQSTRLSSEAITPASTGPLIDIESSTRESKEQAASIGVRNRKDRMSMPDPDRYKPKESQLPRADLEAHQPSTEYYPPLPNKQDRPKDVKEVPQRSSFAVKNHNSWNGLPSLIDALPEPWYNANNKQEDSNITRPLKHRKSWHPGSYNTSDKAFSFSAADVMARYPPLSQLEGSSTTKPYPEPCGSSGDTRSALRPSKSVEFRPPPPPPTKATRSDVRPAKPLSDVSMPPATRPVMSTTQPIPITAPPPFRRAASVRERRVRWPDTEEELSSEQPSRLNRAATSASSAFRSRDASRRDRKLKDVERRLVEMGFSKTEAEAASAGADGNLELAIDLLEEDQAAWKGRRGGRNPFDTASAYTEQMPGAWESWRSRPL